MSIAAYLDCINAQWDRLGRAGSSWTGAERLAMAASTRGAARAVDLPHLSSARLLAVAAVQCEAPFITATAVEQFGRSGIDRIGWVELVNVVSTTVAIDTFMFGIGAEARPLPEAHPGPVTRQIDDRADVSPLDRGAFVPTVGPAYATNALSAVPSEHEAARSLQDCFYLPIDALPNMTHVRDLPRPALELIAARTAFLNQSAFVLFTHASMLRASGRASGEQVALRAVSDATVDPATAGGRSLLHLTDALVLRDEDERQTAIDAVAEEWGEAGALRAIAVVSNFEMQCRQFDALGIPIPPLAESLATALGVQHSPFG